MHAVVEAKSMFRVVPRLPDEPKGVWLRKVGQVFGLTQSQAKKIEYEEVKDLRASRLDHMRARLIELNEKAANRWELLNGLESRRAELAGNRSADPARSGEGVESRGGRGGRAGEGGFREDWAPSAVVRSAR